MFKKKLFYLFLTFFFVFLWFKLVDFSRVAAAIKIVKLPLIILALFLGILNSFFGALRLKTLLSVIADIPVSYIWGLGYITSLISLLFPFYLGGLSFAYLIAKKTKSSYSKAFSLIFLDFLIGVLIMFSIAVVAIYYFSRKKLIGVYPDIFNSFIFILVLALAFVVIAVLVFKPKLKKVENLLTRIKKGTSLFNKIIIIKVIALSLVMLVLGTSSSYLYYLALDMKPPVIDFLLASSLFGVLSMIPGAPTKIGQYETLGVLTLPYLLNLPKESIFAMLFLTHIISITSTLLVGLLAIHILEFDAKIISVFSGAKKDFLGKVLKG